MVAKLTFLVAIIGGHVTARLPPIVRFMTKQNSIWSKALIMPLTIWNCVLSWKQKNYFSENWLVLLRNCFHKQIGLNIFYLVLSIHTFIHEHILVQALGLEQKQYAYRVLLPITNLLLSTFLTGGKSDFQVANLLLATVSFEPCTLY